MDNNNKHVAVYFGAFLLSLFFSIVPCESIIIFFSCSNLMALFSHITETISRIFWLNSSSPTFPGLKIPYTIDILNFRRFNFTNCMFAPLQFCHLFKLTNVLLTLPWHVIFFESTQCYFNISRKKCYIFAFAIRLLCF